MILRGGLAGSCELIGLLDMDASLNELPVLERVTGEIYHKESQID
jgi:hypothetical protein